MNAQRTKHRTRTWTLGSWLFGVMMLAMVGWVWAKAPTRTLPNLDAIADVGRMVRGQGLRRRGYVVDVRSKSAFPKGTGSPNTRVVSVMMARLMMGLTGRRSGQAAWATWFGPGDKVGIQIDAQGNTRTRVHRETVAAVVGGLRSAGVQNKDIIVWASTGQSLSGAGFPLNWKSPGIRFVGVNQLPADKSMGYKMKAGMFGRRLPISSLVRRCRFVINIANYEDHPVIGARLALANQVLSAFKGSQLFERHWGGAVGIGEIATWKLFRQKYVLHIIDGLTGTYDGQAAIWHPQIYLASTDPVALDRTAFNLLDSTRRATGVYQIAQSRRRPRYIDIAAMNGVGEGNVDKIQHKTIQVP